MRTSQERTPQERFDYYVTNMERNPFNKRIGDFIYVHEEANPRWLCFFDRQGNTVMHGGRGDATDVIVRLRPESRGTLLPRLIAYMTELVGRHGEQLHTEGQKQFHGVTISLPYRLMEHAEYCIHTGSGCCYDQDEIAYEVMAALSGVPVYKAISPRSCGNFVREDKTDDSVWIVYSDKQNGFRVSFSHVNDGTSVVVENSKHFPRSHWTKFQADMCILLAEFVSKRTGKEFVFTRGRTKYEAENPLDAVEVDIASGSTFGFAVKVPYGLSFEHFPRLAFAKAAMKFLSERFPRAEPSAE